MSYCPDCAKLERELAEARKEHANDQRVIGLCTQRERKLRDKLSDAHADYDIISTIHGELCDKAWKYLAGTQCCYEKDIVDHLIERCGAARAEVEAAFRAGYNAADWPDTNRQDDADAAWSRYQQERKA